MPMSRVSAVESAACHVVNQSARPKYGLLPQAGNGRQVEPAAGREALPDHSGQGVEEEHPQEADRQEE
jgi:hypothetical protein